MKSFRRLMDWGTLLLAGYKQAGIFEIGPASTFYSFNPVEGIQVAFWRQDDHEAKHALLFRGLCGLWIRRSEMEILFEWDL